MTFDELEHMIEFDRLVIRPGLLGGIVIERFRGIRADGAAALIRPDIHGEGLTIKSAAEDFYAKLYAADGEPGVVRL
jgi:hypothetical protein